MADAPADPLHDAYLALGAGVLAIVVPLVVAIVWFVIWREWREATEPYGYLPDEPERLDPLPGPSRDL